MGCFFVYVGVPCAVLVGRGVVERIGVAIQHRCQVAAYNEDVGAERAVGIAHRDLLTREPPDFLCMGRVLGDVGEGKLLAVGLADVLHRAVHAHGALFNPNSAFANSLDLVHGVAH